MLCAVLPCSKLYRIYMNKKLFRRSSHALFCIRLHIVFVTKYRRKVITAPILERLKSIFSELCEAQDCIVIEFNGEADHVHLLLDIAPTVSISELVKILKSGASRVIRKEFADHLKKFYFKPVFWSSSYFVNSCGGAPLETVRKYIQNQDSPNTDKS